MKRLKLSFNIVAISLSLLFVNSCKVDEFKFDELGIKEGWDTKLVVPLFYGDLEFKDFITDWYNYEGGFNINDPITTLRYRNEFYREIPTSLIFEPSVVIDDFPFLVQGDYELDSISLEFIVTNGSPYPLNLELLFFNKESLTIETEPVTPDPFSAGELNGNSIEPTKTVHFVDFTTSQNEEFATGNRVRFTSWYNRNDFKKDTLLASYPIEVSIIMHGVIKNRNEEN